MLDRVIAILLEKNKIVYRTLIGRILMLENKYLDVESVSAENLQFCDQQRISKSRVRGQGIQFTTLSSSFTYLFDILHRTIHALHMPHVRVSSSTVHKFGSKSRQMSCNTGSTDRYIIANPSSDIGPSQEHCYSNVRFPLEVLRNTTTWNATCSIPVLQRQMIELFM